MIMPAGDALNGDALESDLVNPASADGLMGEHPLASLALMQGTPTVGRLCPTRAASVYYADALMLTHMFLKRRMNSV